MKLIIEPSETVQLHLQSISNLCIELWNMTLQQRRNKYSWGKTNLATHEQELNELKQEFPEYQQPHHEVLMNVFRSIDAAYQYFMPRRKQKGIKPPTFKTQGECYIQHYSGDSFTIEKNKLNLRYDQKWLVIDLPSDDYSDIKWVEIGFDKEWWIVLNT